MLAIFAGLALIAASVGAVVAWTRWGGRIFGSVLVPALFGISLLVRARWGTIELSREQHLLLVEKGGVWPRRRDKVALRDLKSVETVPDSFRAKDPDYELNLVLADERRLHLRRAGSEAALERDRAAIADFLREHQLLWGGGDPQPEPTIRTEDLLDGLTEDTEDRTSRK
jgi:hypothetical protein